MGSRHITRQIFPQQNAFFPAKIINDSIIAFDILANTMKVMIGILIIGLLLIVSMGGYQPSFTTLYGFNSSTLVNVIDDAINYCEEKVESLSAC